MPSNNRKRNTYPKRLEVTDPTGWTHVTTTKKPARQVLRTTTAHQEEERSNEPFLPAEAPSRLTAESLSQQFQNYRQKWDASSTRRVVEETVRSRTRTQSARTEDEMVIVCVGLGSPSGFLRGGWVDRRSVSMYQLAGLVGVMEVMKETTPSIQVYAQDPVFNAHDKALLSFLGITVVEHPHGFEKVSPSTFLYCPGAEQTHLAQLLSSKPRFVFGGPLEDIEAEEVKQFVASKKSVRLPRFEEQEHAFWNMRVYFPGDTDDDDNAQNGAWEK